MTLRPDEPGFEDWARARGPVRVGSARAMTGADEDAAQRAVVEALASAAPVWGQLRQEPDVDARVLGAALHVLDPAAHGIGAVVDPDLSVPADADRRPLPLPEVEAAAAAGATQRRRRRRRLGAVVVAVVLVLAVVLAGAAALLAPDRPQPAVTAADNPVPLAWWGDDVLHLADVEVELPGVTALAPDPDDEDGVVFEDADGYGRVAADGKVDWTDERPEGLDRGPTLEASGYTLELPDAGLPGDVEITDDEGRPVPLLLEEDDLVVAASLRLGGVVVLAVSFAPASVEQREFRRLSETGPTVLGVCDLQMVRCRPVARLADGRSVLLAG